MRGETTHVDLLRVRLDQAIHAVVPLELHGRRRRPGRQGRRRAGADHARAERRGAADGDPRVDRARRRRDADRRHAHARRDRGPEGVTLLDDLEETVLATLSPPRLQSEARPRSRPRPSSSARPEREAGDADGGGRSARGVAPCDALRRRRRGHRLADRRAGQPRPRVRAHTAQRRLHGRRGSSPSAGSCRAPRTASAGASPRAARAVATGVRRDARGALARRRRTARGGAAARRPT